MQFLYPTSRQFPFDEVCEQIVRALEARGWKVPGLVVEFRDYGSGEQKLRYVSSVRSDQSAIDLGHHDVAIEFGRPQGRLPGGRWNDVAAVSEVQIPRRSLRVYEDESGPTYNVYVGDDWEHDRRTWWTRPNARLNGDPRLCVGYSGAYPRYEGKRPWQLVATEDYREYEPQGDEPRSFTTSTVMEDFRSYLRGMLSTVEEFPATGGGEDVCAEPPPIPMPDGAGPFFAYGEGRDAARIEAGKTRPGDLALADRYGLAGGGWRLAPTGIRRGPDLPEVAFDGFLWCGTIGAEGWRIPGDQARWSADVVIKVTPRNARGIYVADHAAYEKRRAELARALEGKRDRFTEAEVADFIRARACTVVPICDYKGDYEDPVYLVNRELGLDEVEVIGRLPA